MTEEEQGAVVIPMRTKGVTRWWFHCPGCKSGHAFMVYDGSGKGWTFNGDAKRPTFNPSLVVEMSGPTGDVRRCHLFVRDGQIQFLGDCDHDLKGKTVPMEPEE